MFDINHVKSVPASNPIAIPSIHGERGETSASGANHNTPLKSATSFGLPRVTSLQRKAMQQQKDEVDQQEDDLDTLHAEYAAKSVEFQGDISFIDFCNLKSKPKARNEQRATHNQHHRDLQHRLGKHAVPSFDGSNEISARAWIQNLNTYFSLSPMYEGEAIKFATLHLEGVAHEWWYHGLVTQGHSLITTYEEFCRRLIDRFERQDPEEHFTKLAQLQHHGSVDIYVADFQRPDVEPPVKASSIKNTNKYGRRQSSSLTIADNNRFAHFEVDLNADSVKDIPTICREIQS